MLANKTTTTLLCIPSSRAVRPQGLGDERACLQRGRDQQLPIRLLGQGLRMYCTLAKDSKVVGRLKVDESDRRKSQRLGSSTE